MGDRRFAPGDKKRGETMKRVSGWCALAVLTASCAQLQTAPVGPVSGDGAARSVLQVCASPAPVLSPAAYLQMVHSNNLGEIALGTLALQKAETAGVREFAQMLITDHTAVDAKVRALAGQKDVALKDVLLPAAEAAKAKLEALTGKAFEREFLAINVAGHDKAIGLTKAEADKGEDADVRTFAAGLLPGLNKHRSTAEALLKAMTE